MTTRTAPEGWKRTDPDEARLVAVTPSGKVMANGYMCWLLTPCCDASGKGSIDAYASGGTGVICRACHQDVDFNYGDADGATPEEIEGFVARNGGHDREAEKKEGLS